MGRLRRWALHRPNRLAPLVWLGILALIVVVGLFSPFRALEQADVGADARTGVAPRGSP